MPAHDDRSRSTPDVLILQGLTIDPLRGPAIAHRVIDRTSGRP